MPSSTAIAAGELRHVITIAQANATEDKFGGSDPDLGGATPLFTVRAKIDALSGRELYAAQQKIAEVTHRVVIRYARGITAGMLVWFRGRQFQIQYVENPRELNKLLVLLCLERDDSAREEGEDISAAGVPQGGNIPTGGGSSGPTGLHAPVEFTASGGETSFTLPDVPAGAVAWFRNGLAQMTPDEYLVSGRTVTITTPANHGDTFLAIY